jgi:pilus assembly protein CpaE
MNPSLEQAKPGDRIRVLIIPSSDPVGDWMAELIEYETDMQALGLVRDLNNALASVKELAPDVILVDIGSGILQQGDLINRLSAPTSGAAIIVVAMMSEVDMVRQAMLYGAQGFLLKPFSETELFSSVRQAYELITQRRAELAELPHLIPGGEAGQTPQAEIITVYSPKGGVGCTTIAINLAVALKATTGKPVTLIDGDLRFGDINTALNISTTTSVGTIVAHLDELDDHLLERSLVRHSSGIQVAVAPPHLDAADSIRPEDLKRLLLRLSAMSEGYIVVDAWSALDDTTLAFLDVSQHLLLVTSPQVTALRDTHRFLQVLGLLDFDLKKTKLIMNHCYNRSTLKVKEMERALGQPIAQAIGHTPQQVTSSLNRGIPLLEEYRDSPAAKDILSLAQQIAGTQPGERVPSREATPESPAPERPRRRGFFFGGHSAPDKVTA